MRRLGLALCCMLCVSLATASQFTPRQRLVNGNDGPAQDDEITCRVVYYTTCSQTSESCVSSTAAGSCCGDCRHSDGTHAPCQACKAN